MKATSTRRFAALGAMAMAMAAALVALAIAMPGNASAYTFESNTYYIGDGEIVELNQHDPSKSVYVFVDGKATIKGDINAYGRLEFMPETNSNDTHLTINGDVSGGTVIFDGYFDPAQFKVTINGTNRSISANNALTVKTAILTAKSPYGIIVGRAEINNATVTSNGTKSASNNPGMYVGLCLTASSAAKITATGYDKGMDLGGIEANDSTIIGTANKKGTGSIGIYCPNDIESKNCTITGTGYDRGIEAGNLSSTNSKITGKASKPKSSTLATGKYAYGIKIHNDPATPVSIVGGELNASASAASKSLSKTDPKCVALWVTNLNCFAGTIKATNTGKYGVGIFSPNAIYAFNEYENGTGARSTLNAYAKNAGIGVLIAGSPELSYGALRISGSDATIYGGKYGVYTNNAAVYILMNSKANVYGKNASGTRTGHGIYAKNGPVYIYQGCKVNVTAKKSSSYYGIYSYSTVDHWDWDFKPGVFNYRSTVSVSAYSSNAFRYKLAGKSKAKGAVTEGTLKINGTTQKSYPKYVIE